jgi:hypothetical protein
MSLWQCTRSHAAAPGTQAGFAWRNPICFSVEGVVGEPHPTMDSNGPKNRGGREQRGGGASCLPSTWPSSAKGSRPVCLAPGSSPFSLIQVSKGLVASQPGKRNGGTRMGRKQGLGTQMSPCCHCPLQDGKLSHLGSSSKWPHP